MLPPLSRLALTGCCALGLALPALAQVINIEDRVELFADDFLVEKLEGGVRRVVQKPEPKEVVMTFDAAWESNSVGMVTVFADGDRYRMYYRGGRSSGEKKAEVTCTAESRDGIAWERPTLNLFDWEGSKANNIVWAGDSATHNFAPFKDGNPEAPASARYKAIGQSRAPRAYESADGIHWKLVLDKGLVTKGTFDSHNIAFWDAFRSEYRMYWRFNPKSEGGPLHDRAIRTATSPDFTAWGTPRDVRYPGIPEPETWEQTAQLYTSGVLPYFRAPQIYVGFPTRFILVKVGQAEGKKSYSTEPQLMMSRDGVNFQRWEEPVIPQTAPADRGGNRSNFMAWGMVQLPGKPDEISVYAKENYMAQTPVRLRRFVYRLDGFVALEADASGGEVLTPALLFSGSELKLNYRAKPGGEVRVELQGETGNPLEGYTLAECEPLTGDSTRAVVRWKAGADLSKAAAQGSVRLRFVVKNAELFSVQL